MYNQEYNTKLYNEGYSQTFLQEILTVVGVSATVVSSRLYLRVIDTVVGVSATIASSFLYQMVINLVVNTSATVTKLAERNISVLVNTTASVTKQTQKMIATLVNTVVSLGPLTYMRDIITSVMTEVSINKSVAAIRKLVVQTVLHVRTFRWMTFLARAGRFARSKFIRGDYDRSTTLKGRRNQ